MVGVQDLGRGRDHLRDVGDRRSRRAPGCSSTSTRSRAASPGLEPFEVMISESQERMVAIVEPARWEAVRAVCERWDLPVAIIGRVTPEPDIVVLTGPDGAGALDGDGRPVAGARELARIPAAALASGAIVFQRESRPPTRRRAAPAPGAPARARRHAAAARPGPGRGAPGAAGLAQPLVAALRCTSSTTHNVQANTVAGPGRGAAVLRIKGTTKALVASTDANAPVGVLDPWLGAAMSVAEAARNVADHRRAAAGRHELPQLRRPDPARGVLAAQRGRPRPVRRLPRARACRSPAATCRCTTRRPASAIAPTPEIGVVGLLEDVAKRVGPAFRADGQRRAARRRAGRRPRGQRVRAARRRRRPRTGRPRSTWPARRALQAFIREAVDRGLVESCQDVVRRRPRGRGRRDGDLGRSSARSCGSPSATRRRSACSARARRGWSSRSRPRHVPAFILLARQHGLPGDELGFTGGARLVIELAGEGATGAAEERGSRIADALDVSIDDLRHAWEHGLPRALGWEEHA